jgi:hypothetical protein
VRSLLLAALLLAATPAAAEECQALLAARGHLAASQRAASPTRAAWEKARDAWASAPASCRSGMWYVTAANLLRAPRAPKELVAEGVRFTGASEALAAGLTACPRDAALLAYLAYLARVEPAAAPPLPADACTTVDASDAALRAYVCGSQAIAAGRWADAEKQLAGIEPERFPDLARLLAAIRAHTGRKLPDPPPPRLGCDPFCPMESWRR